MTHRVKVATFAASLGLLSIWAVNPRTAAAQQTQKAVAAAPIARVYVQTTRGINLYNASAAGQLSLVTGSPFADAGQMEGVNAGYLLSVGTNYLHSYKLGPNGAVGAQASQANTQSYGGSECGNTYGAGAVLDHTGQDFYVQLFGAPGSGGVSAMCAAWQTYRVGSNGSLTFLGDIVYNGNSDHNATMSSVPTISSSDKFAYGIFPEFGGYSSTDFSTFTRASNGEWQFNNTFTEKDPVPNQNRINAPWVYLPEFVQADPAGHLAVAVVNRSYQGCCGYYGAEQLASYTIDPTTGGIASTNTYQNMPTPAVASVNGSSLTGMKMSPSGKILAVTGTTGLQFFHFDGAAPITTFGRSVLSGVTIDQLGWDNSNHFYALSYKSGALYVYTATPTGFQQVAGSPYKVTNAYGIKGMTSRMAAAAPSRPAVAMLIYPLCWLIRGNSTSLRPQIDRQRLRL